MCILQIIAHVMDHLPRKASIAIPLAGVCLAWRTAILSEETYLRNVEFKIDCNQPFKGLAPIKGDIVSMRQGGRACACTSFPLSQQQITKISHPAVYVPVEAFSKHRRVVL